MKAEAKQKLQRLLSPSLTPIPEVGTSRFSPSRLISSRPTSPVPPAPSSPPTSGDVPLPVESFLSAPAAMESKHERALEAASSFQTLLNIVDKTLDGMPVWGPKAAIVVAAEVLKATRVRADKVSIAPRLVNN